MKGWATRPCNMNRVPLEMAAMTAVVTPQSLFQKGAMGQTPAFDQAFRAVLSLSPFSFGNIWLIHVPCTLPQDKLTESVCRKVNFNYSYLGHPRIAPWRTTRGFLEERIVCNEISVSNKVEAHSGEWPKETLKEKKQRNWSGWRDIVPPYRLSFFQYVIIARSE